MLCKKLEEVKHQDTSKLQSLKFFVIRIKSCYCLHTCCIGTSLNQMLLFADNITYKDRLSCFP